MRRLLSLFTSLGLVIVVCLFAACGGGNSSNSATNSASPGASGSGSSGSGSSSGSASPGTGSSGGSSSFVAYAYTASASEIRAYGVSSNGSLTSVSGSPYAFSTVQNGNIVTNGSNLYAIAEGYTNLNIFSVNKSSGALALAATTGAIAGDPNPMDLAAGLALDHTGSFLYVDVGLSDQDSGINVFTAGGGPSAQQIKYLSTGAYTEPPLVFSPNNQFAYSDLCTARVDGVFGYVRASDGTLTSMNPGNLQGPTGSPGVGFCLGPLAASVKGYMAIVWIPTALGSSVPSNQPYVVTYTINSDGRLTAVSNSQVAPASTSGNKIVVNFDPTGSVLALAGDAGVQTYSLNGNGALTPIGAPQNAGSSFQNVAWDTANHLLATTSNQLYVFNSSSGVLTPASGSPYAGDQQLAVLPLQ